MVSLTAAERAVAYHRSSPIPGQTRRHPQNHSQLFGRILRGGGAKHAAKYIARPTNTRQFDERANGSLSQHASAVLVVSLFRHWLLNCMAFYFQAPCAGAHESYEVGPSSELLIALGVRQGTLYCFYPRMPRTLVMPLVMVAYALCLKRIPTFLL